MTDPLTEELLALPVGPQVVVARRGAKMTSSIELSGDTLTATIADVSGTVNEGTALAYLEEEGQQSDDWEVTGFRKIKYGQGMESVRFTFRRRQASSSTTVPLDEILARIEVAPPVYNRPTGSHGFVLALGDMQFGKIDGDGVEGTLARTIACIDRSAEKLLMWRTHYDVGHVHIAWLGDHVEGFVSQSGANAWRTGLTMSEQIRLTRRVMLHALETFAPMSDRLTMAAVPGNHGEPQRFNGKGLTRHADSHDTEALVAVADAAALNRTAFGHVEFYVPGGDEIAVHVDVAGTHLAHVHGHHWRPGKHFDWWKGQAFDETSPWAQADVLLAGHLHHEHVDSDGPRLFVQVPSLESESTWWRLSKGSKGNPGVVIGITKDGRMDLREVVRA